MARRSGKPKRVVIEGVFTESVRKCALLTFIGPPLPSRLVRRHIRMTVEVVD